MIVTRDVPYGTDAAQRLDVFAPDGARRAPVLIDIHGGAWRGGSRAGRGHLAAALTARGMVWIPIDYGLAPDHGIDAIVHHAREAVAWVHRTVASHGGDPDRIFVSGNSSGGHLAAAMLMTGWHARYGVPADVVKGVCAISGVYDLVPLVGAPPGGPNDQLAMDAETARRNSPIHSIPASAPPLIVAVGVPEQTDFKSQAEGFARAWTAAGLQTLLIEVPDAHHFAMARQIGEPASILHSAVMAMIEAA